MPRDADRRISVQRTVAVWRRPIVASRVTFSTGRRRQPISLRPTLAPLCGRKTANRRTAEPRLRSRRRVPSSPPIVRRCRCRVHNAGRRVHSDGASAVVRRAPSDTGRRHAAKAAQSTSRDQDAVRHVHGCVFQWSSLSCDCKNNSAIGPPVVGRHRAGPRGRAVRRAHAEPGFGPTPDLIIGDSIQSGRTCTGHRIKQVFASSEKATSSSTTSRVPALG